jgi:protein-S-isoprenylcysteine O-methyltransferase Ste14
VIRRRRGPITRVSLSLVVTAIEASLLALALGGFLAVWEHPQALALIVVWAVSGIALVLKRPVGDQDLVEVARESRGTLLALALVPMLTPAIAALGERLGLWLLPGGPPSRWAGVAIVALGLTIRIMAMSQLGARFSPLLAVQREHSLETTGLYRRIRHPGYLGSFLAALGAVMAFGSGLGLLPLLIFGALMVHRTRREEALLDARFGETWRAYRARSGAFLPHP